MEETLEFPVLLRLIDERSTAFRAAVMSAPGLELKVPTCPEWTLLDLVQHLGAVHRKWAAAVNAGPAAAPPAESASEGAATAPGEREPLLAWSAASTQQLLDALREAGPDRGCWTWWGPSQSPQISYEAACQASALPAPDSCPVLTWFAVVCGGGSGARCHG
ncbi:MAG: maleylpyruvate isomerase N-terminal domain-containing protein, partial [Streptosporangiaceae bacterium]